ncbi:hypothetical protein CR513_14459, partial [Mucuna pruriens]
MSIRDEFPNEQLLHINMPTPWFADIYNLVAVSQFPPRASWLYKEILQSDFKYYIWGDPYLWRLCNDQVISRCILDTEINSVLQFCHAAPRGGHYGSTRTAKKVLDCGFYWPTIFRDIYQFISTCEKCQKAGMAINYVSRWVEATTIKTNDAKVVFGVPKALISDQGSHFCNRAMSSLLHKYGVVHRVATAYHP